MSPYKCSFPNTVLFVCLLNALQALHVETYQRTSVKTQLGLLNPSVSPDTSIEAGIWILSVGATNTGILEQEVYINMLIIITFPLYWKTSATFPSLWNNWSSSFHLHLTSILLEQKLSLMNFSLLHFFPNVNYFLVELDQMCIFAQALSHLLMFVAFWVFPVIDAIYICAMEASIVLPNIFFQVIVVRVTIIHCSTSFLELHPRSI